MSFLLAFAVAIGALQRGWSQFRSTLETPTPGGWAVTLAYLAMFGAAFLYLGFWLYAQDRAAGRIRRSITLYEMFLPQRTDGMKGRGD